ncbi:hypothetical protein [Occultella kanbiaonis]|uniref:hypothetical protein n=1 Tax=Occultella kanbiaonis TaxID=2675754 RepID=UPI0012BA1852|nr:hypothetical protein [Occultella kanbiaonis]
MARTDVAAAVNARVSAIVSYGLDRRGAGLFAALTGRTNGELNGSRPVVDTARDGGRTFHGTTATPQRFTGIAPLGIARPVAPTNGTMADELSASPLNDGALRIFAQRLARGRR